jgi:hypothetical protein
VGLRQCWDTFAGQFGEHGQQVFLYLVGPQTEKIDCMWLQAKSSTGKLFELGRVQLNLPVAVTETNSTFLNTGEDLAMTGIQEHS